MEVPVNLAVAAVVLKSPRFDAALDRTMAFRKALRSRLNTVEVEGRYNLLSLVISDCPVNTFRVNRKAAAGLYQIFVGYDINGAYSEDGDADVISLMAGWVRRAFKEAPGYAAKRAELLGIVDLWEAESVASIVARRRTTGGEERGS
jgi:hypothetical protein